jgi:hypothetical protein
MVKSDVSTLSPRYVILVVGLKTNLLKLMVRLSCCKAEIIADTGIGDWLNINQSSRYATMVMSKCVCKYLATVVARHCIIDGAKGWPIGSLVQAYLFLLW